MKKYILIGLAILIVIVAIAATLTYTCTALSWDARENGDQITMTVLYGCMPSNPLKPIYFITREKSLPINFVDN